MLGSAPTNNNLGAGTGSTISTAIGGVSNVAGAAKAAINGIGNLLGFNNSPYTLASQLAHENAVSEQLASSSDFSGRVNAANSAWLAPTTSSSVALTQLQAQQIIKALLSSEEIYEDRGDSKTTTKDVTDAQITEAKKLLDDKLKSKIKGSTGNLDSESVIDRLANAFGGNKKFMDAISNLSEIELRNGDITELKTRFGGAAGAYYDSGSNKIVIGQHSDMGTLVHEVGHAIDASDGAMDGKFEGYDKLNNLMADATKKIRDNDYYMEGLGSLTYGFDASNPDKTEELAELTRLKVTHPEEFAKHFPELADEFDKVLNEDGQEVATTTEPKDDPAGLQVRNGVDPLMIALIMNSMLPKQMFPTIPLGPFFNQRLNFNPITPQNNIFVTV